MSKTYQRRTRRTQAAATEPADATAVDAAVAMPEHVQVVMAEIAGSVKEGLPALAVGAGMQVMAAMMEESVTSLRPAR